MPRRDLRFVTELLGTVGGALERTGAAVKQASRAFSSRDGLEIRFPFEGEVRVRVPRIALLGGERDRLSRATLGRRLGLAQRPHYEPLLRNVTYRLLTSGVIAPGRSVIDIGCWIGDNALVWAQLVDPERSSIYAIDPSQDNLRFAETIAAHNGITNIRFIEAVCSDASGQPMVLDGSPHHATFRPLTSPSAEHATRTTTTLDEIIGLDSWGSVGLVHVDVEGLELRVLKGATNILVHSRPFVLFEGHLRDVPEIGEVARFLRGFNYTVFMINEVLIGSRLDCRNFLAVGDERVDEVLRAIDDPEAPRAREFPAAVGPRLIELAPQSASG